MKSPSTTNTEIQECTNVPGARKIFGVTLGVVLICFVLGFGIGKLLYWLFS